MAALKRPESRPAGGGEGRGSGLGALCPRLGRPTAWALGRRAPWAPALAAIWAATGDRPGALEATTSITQVAGVPSGGGASPRRGLGPQVGQGDLGHPEAWAVLGVWTGQRCVTGQRYFGVTGKRVGHLALVPSCPFLLGVCLATAGGAEQTPRAERPFCSRSVHPCGTGDAWLGGAPAPWRQGTRVMKTSHLVPGPCRGDDGGGRRSWASAGWR